MGLKHVSSASFQAWRTPKRIADALRVEYDLQLDAAADFENSVCAAFFDGSEGSNGLVEDWTLPHGGVWINPPYEDVTPWLSKAILEVYHKASCDRAVMLVPAAVGVSWFSGACRIAEVHLFDERIRFDLPPKESLSKEWQDKLFTQKGKPKRSPGGGNALVILERDGLVGVTAMRSSKTGRMTIDFTDGAVYEP